MITDTISDMLTRIRNACLVKKRIVYIPYTRLNSKIVEILEKEGFILKYEFLNKKDSNKSLKKPMFESITNEVGLGSRSSFKKTPIKKLTQLKVLKIYLKYYKKYKTKFYNFNNLKNQESLTTFKNLIKLLRGKQARQKVSCITHLQRVSKPGLRVYANHTDLPRVLGGAGIVILSTSKGLMTDREARFRGIGGEILLECF
uniref:Small ribosomal subunit protein uS8c n=1 Tax=Koshicola spirodelophila TaxID=1707787 RepID=A0A167MGF5_9CHLO|nr:ribosomal protein S8 [Koshicola spirodelophila]